MSKILRLIIMSISLAPLTSVSLQAMMPPCVCTPSQVGEALVEAGKIAFQCVCPNDPRLTWNVTVDHWLRQLGPIKLDLSFVVNKETVPVVLGLTGAALGAKAVLHGLDNIVTSYRPKKEREALLANQSQKKISPKILFKMSIAQIAAGTALAISGTLVALNPEKLLSKN